MNRLPQFKRPNFGHIKRVKENWRKPRGIDSKQRQKLKWAGAVVKVGYRTAAATRGDHPRGKREFLVQGPKDIETPGLEKFVLRLSATLSKRSKEAIRKKAAEKKLSVLN
ncbi:MAG: eL32 family ribosomal protein [Candidatus Micrarchaeota archaeon]